MSLNVLLLGSGAREHTLAWSIAQSELLAQLYIAPGNPGTAQCGENVELSLSDFEGLLSFVEEKDIDLTVVGPEQPLVGGITDFLEAKGHSVFGPSKAAAQLEGSKEFANAFMEENMIPTAAYKAFAQNEFDDALTYIKQQNDYPVVLKADGLAGGKGVFICETEDEVVKRLQQLKEDASLSSAAQTLVVEEFLEGEEASVFVITDGKTARIIHNAQDHKRAKDGDMGLNTGGMGAYCPTPLLTDELMHRVKKEIVLPTLAAMAMDNHTYKGILYCGLMITQDGRKVVEYNCRFGDPECQVIVPSLTCDLLGLIWATAEGRLDEESITLDDQYRCCVVLTSGGYPTAYEKGKEITGIDTLSEDTLLFHAGTRLEEGYLLTNGGRVLNVVAAGDTLEEAIQNTYKEVKKISFDQMHYRSDIGVKGLAYLD